MNALDITSIYANALYCSGIAAGLTITLLNYIIR